MKAYHDPVAGIVREVTAGDLDWIVARLAERRAALVPYAPVYWRPAADAAAAHRRFLGRSLQEGRALGFRTDEAVLIAASGRDGWTVDDAVVPGDDWPVGGRVLWDELAARVSGSRVRFVYPSRGAVSSPAPSAFALARHGGISPSARRALQPRAARRRGSRGPGPPSCPRRPSTIPVAPSCS
ncbi:MAG: hypothetical protein JWM19_6568 [Actinomycetia bacterium]|nr:hypothetical protein [Actinomycetes bacterium]